MPDTLKSGETPSDSKSEDLRSNSAGYEPSSDSRWIRSVVPFNVATGPVSTLIVLLILSLHGTVIDVGFAVTLFNAVSIPAAIFWGFASDRLRRRKVIIVLSYLVTAVVILLFLFARNVYAVWLLYASFSFITAAVTTPLNLLIMETSPKPKWSSAFAWFSMLTSVGQTAGLILSTLWTSFFLLTYLVIPLAALSVISAVMSVLMIKEPSVSFERQIMVHNKNSFFQRLKDVPVIFFHLPRLSDFKRLFRALRYDLTRNVPILYFSIFMFYIAAGLFNTSVLPSLAANKTTNLTIFFVVTVVYIVQTLSFQYAGSYVAKISLLNASVQGLTMRAAGYAALGVAFYLLSGNWYVIPAVILYSIAGGFAYAIYYTASNIMVFNTLGGNREGSSLGVYSALVGIATMVGALISGFISFYVGYGMTFLVAAACLASSIMLLQLLREPKKN